MTKRCKTCGEELPVASFSPNGTSRRGTPTLRPSCRGCEAEHRRLLYARNPERFKASRLRYEAVKGAAWFAARAATWRAQNPDYYYRDLEASRRRGRIKASRRRALLAGCATAAIDPLTVFARSMGLCGICGEPVERDAFDVDHIVPLSKGGAHTYANVQAAHPSCNSKKGARTCAGDSARHRMFQTVAI